MRIVVDTSIWIEFLKGLAPTAGVMRRLLEEHRVWALECVFGELLQGAKNDRERQVIMAYWEALPKIEDRGLWLQAGIQSGKDNWPSMGLGLIDGVIIAAARARRASVWTLDKKILGILEEDERFNLERDPF